MILFSVVMSMLILSVLKAGADQPHIGECVVSPCDDFMGVVIYPQPIPGGAAEFTVTVQTDEGVPFTAAFVEVWFGQPSALQLCDDAQLTATTNYNGTATFAISGGGCIDEVDAVIIKVNGVELRNYPSIKSPDFAPGGNGVVELSDFICFGNAMATGAGGCTDYYNEGVTGLSAFIVFGEAWTRSCP